MIPCTYTKMAGKNEIAGYSCEFLEKPADYLQVECPVCLQILRESHLTSCCGYSFCRACIQRVQADRKACPTCNEKAFTVLGPNKGLQRMLNNFKVLCSNVNLGCKWTGELGSFDNHLNADPPKEKQLEGCEYTQVECMYCNNMFVRNEIAQHQSDHCLKRPFDCEYCKTYETHYEDVVNNHWPLCDLKPVPCPNKCGGNPLRGELKKHIDDDCPLTLIDCEFPGCEVKNYRKDMPDHLQKALAHHVSLLATHMTRQLQCEVKALTKQVAELQTENKSLKKEVEVLTKHLAILTKERIVDHNNSIKFTMSDATLHQKNQTSQHFHSFYTQWHGYKMKFEAGFCRDNFLAVRVYLLQGEFDNDLVWPVKGSFFVSLWNQGSNCYNVLHTYSFIKKRCTEQMAVLINLGNTYTLSLPIPSTYVTQDNCLNFSVKVVIQ